MYGYLAPEIAYTLRLTTKCDMYSFGVLSVEVITGIHPGEFISSIAASSSRSSASDILIDILDNHIHTTTPAIFEELCFVGKLALACLNVNPEVRSTSEFVSNKLHSYKISYCVIQHDNNWATMQQRRVTSLQS